MEQDKSVHVGNDSISEHPKNAGTARQLPSAHFSGVQSETNQNNTNQADCLLKTDSKPEDFLLYGKQNVSLGKILQLQSQEMSLREIGKELGVNYMVVARALKKYSKGELGIQQNTGQQAVQQQKKPAENLEQITHSSNPSYKDHTLGKYFNLGQLIISSYLKEK